MFGYIKIDKNELKVRDYNLFKSYYCGVCRTLKKEYGFPAHYFLSYDVTFLAVLLSAVSDRAPAFSQVRCMANPALRRPAADKDCAIEYAAAVNVLLVWFKLKDDWADNHSLKAAFLMPMMILKRNKAKKHFPLLYETIQKRLRQLSRLEKQNCSEPDAVAAVFGKLMADIFNVPEMACEQTNRILSHAGFILGRLIYLLDAWADREEDKKKKAYNPFLLKGKENEEDFRLSLDYSLGELGNTINLLELNRNQDIIENIIYLGLRQVTDTVLSSKGNHKNRTTKEKQHERPI